MGMKINISDLTLDQFIYPRGAKSRQTISAYVEALAIGAQFPPIKIQRVFNYTDADGNETMEATIILDGIHRWSAFKEKGIKEIAAVEWKDKPIDYEKNKIPLLLESAQCNTSHGDRLSSNDKKRIARDVASTDPECKWTESALAEKLGVIQQTVNTWISDIRARQKASRNTVILRLSRLGWLQEKIAETTGITRGRIAQIVNNTNFGKINTLLFHGHDMDYIARHYHFTKPGDLILCTLSSDLRSLTSDFCLLPPCPVEPGSLPGCSTGVSSERLSGNHLPVRCTQTGMQRMQDKRILGTLGRTLLIAKRS